MEWWTFLTFSLVAIFSGHCQYNSEDTARLFIDQVNKIILALKNNHALASYAYDTNITEANLRKKLKAANFAAEQEKFLWEEIVQFNWHKFEDPDLRRQFKFYSVLGSAVLPREKFVRMEIVKSQMKKLYSTATICVDQYDKDCGHPLDPDVVRRFANIRKPELLKTMWVNWRKAIGPKVRPLYKEYVDLSNEAARLNNFTNTAEHWLDDFEDPNFTSSIRRLWNQMKPLYVQIHAYVRYHLRKKYGDIVSATGPIPAHLLVLERIMELQIRDYLAANNILPLRQSGFRKGHSCATALCDVFDDVIEACIRTN